MYALIKSCPGCATRTLRSSLVSSVWPPRPARGGVAAASRTRAWPGRRRRPPGGGSLVQTVRCCCAVASSDSGTRAGPPRMCSLRKHGDKVYVLELEGSAADDEHRLSPSTLTQLLGHLETVNTAADAGALVVTNQGKFFCNGLDLTWLQQDPAARGPALYKQFEELLVALMSVRVPTVGAICGHAAAGGLIVAMALDHRFMRADRGFLYSSAIDIGVAIPPGSLALLQSKVAPRVYKDAVLKCVKYTGDMAVREGMVDVVCEDAGATLREAVKEAEALAARNWDKDVYVAMRRAMYPGVLAGLQGRDSDLFVPGTVRNPST